MPADGRLMVVTPIAHVHHAHSAADATRLRRLIDEHWQPIGRILRSLGVPDGDVDDALQQVYVVASAKLSAIETNKERAFLVQVAVNIAARVRRARGRSREAVASLGSETEEVASMEPSAEESLDRSRALVLLDRVLDGMHEDLRTVLVLYEIEEMTMAEIGLSLALPAGTVASRLRRAREDFQAAVSRIRRGAQS